ncbi:MAG: YdcH family protein [Pseudomonadota bacterium]
MFEERSADELESLLKSNPEFKQLYQQHKDLDRRVMNAELGISPVDDLTLGQLKRQKLAAKDRLVRMADSISLH